MVVDREDSADQHQQNLKGMGDWGCGVCVCVCVLGEGVGVHSKV